MRARSIPWCEARPRTPAVVLPSGSLLAVLGILSTDGRDAMRNASRSTWLPVLPADVRAHFVLRAARPSEPLRAEAGRHGDLLFVNASADLDRAEGPLHSILLWYACAARRYPHTPWVGKLDDDTWLHGAGMASLLRSMLPWVGKPFEAYVGAMEGYHWDEAAGQPVGHRGFAITSPCGRRSARSGALTHNGSVVGPFSFAKGPAFFVSARLGRLLAGVSVAPTLPADAIGADALPTGGWATRGGSGEELAPRAGLALADVLGGVLSRRGNKHGNGSRWGTLPWEDVWVGYTLSRLVGRPRIAAVDLNTELFSDDWGFASKRTALFWHNRIDSELPRRMRALHAWASEKACHDDVGRRSRGLPFSVSCQPSLGGGATVLSCGGAPWLVCRARSKARLFNCSSSAVKLWGRLI